jgi:hypothetical protein
MLRRPDKNTNVAARLGVAIGVIVLAGCSYGPQGHEIAGSNVGATGGVSVSHERLGGTKHLITVNAAPGIAETEGSIGQRILVQANRYAAKTCPSGFKFENDPNNAQQMGAGFMVRSRVFVFTCGA